MRARSVATSIVCVSWDAVEASPGLGGGYQLKAGSSLPPVLLDDEEAVTVAVAAYVSRSIRQVPYRYRMRIKLKGSVAELAKRIPSWCGVLEVLDEESCTLSTGADSIEALAAQVVLTGADFDILEAPECVAEFREIAARLERATRVTMLRVDLNAEPTSTSR